jgi:6-phosphogluconate dehydrogenase
MKAHEDEGKFVATKSLEEFCKSLKHPRSILLMVKAGDAVDDMLRELFEHLEEGDIIIDAGNSLYSDTARRQKRASEKGIHFVGMGVSGGEEGALLGPSMMPGGEEAAYRTLEPLLTKMSADDGAEGKCVCYIGPGGSGHFVKMVHNGIEYGLMQLLAEVYDVLKSEGSSNDDLATVFDEWSKTESLQSFLIDVTAKVLKKKDDESGESLVDLIKDVAGQKGTGKWTVNAALDLGVAIPVIIAAVQARILSGDPEGRARWNKELSEALPEQHTDYKPLKELAKSALELASILTYLEGFELLRKASEEEQWNLPLSEIARIWRGGCIIRSSLLPLFQENFSSDDAKRKAARTKLLERSQGEPQIDWRRFVTIAVERGIPVPALSAALAHFDTLRRPKLPQNLIQAQRDFFGAHGYERRDRDGTFHTHWE